jgi:hypothetical protein
MPATKPAKTQYSEQEAAQELGLSIDEFRTLIKSHIVDNEEDVNNIPVASFHPSDLLLLKLLSSRNVDSTVPG